MSAGLTHLLRLLAVAGMLMSFGQFLLVTAQWVQFDTSGNGPWVGKRVKDVPAKQASPTEAAYKCQQILRQELLAWLRYVQPSGQWLALCGILYLLAGRQRGIAVERSDYE